MQVILVHSFPNRFSQHAPASLVRPEMNSAVHPRVRNLSRNLPERCVLQSDGRHGRIRQRDRNAIIAVDVPHHFRARIGRAAVVRGIARKTRCGELDPLEISVWDIYWPLFVSHRYPEAIQELRSALALQPNDTNALWGLGYALTANGQPQEAIVHLEKALSLSRRSPGVIAAKKTPPFAGEGVAPAFPFWESSQKDASREAIFGVVFSLHPRRYFGTRLQLCV